MDAASQDKFAKAMAESGIHAHKSAPKYTPDGVTYGSLEDTGHAYATCDVCEYVAESLRETGDCPACVAEWEAE